MADRCQCPPVANRGLFKYLTYLIPIRQCSQHRGPGIFYRGVTKLMAGANALQHYTTSLPLGSITNIGFGHDMLNPVVEKCKFFLEYVKPPMEKVVAYIGSYYNAESTEDETASGVGEAMDEVSTKSLPKGEGDTLSAKSASSTKSGGSVKSSDSGKPKGSVNYTAFEKSTGLEKPIVSENLADTVKSELKEGAQILEKFIISDGSVKPTSSTTSSDVKIEIKPGQVKVVKVSVKQPAAEPPATPPVDATGVQLECRTKRFFSSISRNIQNVLNSTLETFQSAFHGVRSTSRYVSNGIVNTSHYVYSAFLKPINYASHGMTDILRGTKEKFVNAGSCSYNYLADCPLWIYIYVLFVCLTVSYLAYQTYMNYKGRMWLQANKISLKIREGCKDFIIPDSTLKQVMAKLRTEIDKGLNPKTKPSSSVKCFTTYVQDLPTGEENGKFLALDLGGTNFRVLLITLNGRHFDMQSKIYVIPQDVMVGTSKNLFNHIAVCLADFTMEHKVNRDNLPLGFTFSFPLKQEGLSKGILQRWTKGFNCPEAINQDVVELLREAIDSHGDLHIDIMAILNDTTGTLMSCAWKNHNTKIGVILGTGTNACYVEKIGNVIDFDGDKSKPFVLINTEWGAFGDNGELDFIRTSYDKEVDSNSINPGSQIHEKLISGMYLGEIVRLLLVKFISEKLIFEGKLNDQIKQRGTLPSEFLSEVESDKRGCFKECKKALAKIGYTQVTDEDCNSVRFVCECVSRRAAHLASAALATLINKMGYSSLTIGVDGSLYRYHPHFHDLMVQKISQLIDDKIMNVNLMLSEDGSGRGAALVAASLF